MYVFCLTTVLQSFGFCSDIIHLQLVRLLRLPLCYSPSGFVLILFTFNLFDYSSLNCKLLDKIAFLLSVLCWAKYLDFKIEFLNFHSLASVPRCIILLRMFCNVALFNHSKNIFKNKRRSGRARESKRARELKEILSHWYFVGLWWI